MKAIERLYQYFDYKDIKPTRLEKEIGVGNGYFSGQLRRDADIGSSIIEKIIENTQDLNIEWLITGVGSMIKDVDQLTMGSNKKQKPQINDTGPPGCEGCKKKDEIIVILRQQVELQNEFIKHLKGSKSPGEIPG